LDEKKEKLSPQHAFVQGGCRYSSTHSELRR